MDHSIMGYLERRSSAELLQFLENCMQQNQWGQYVDTVPLVLETLQGRNCPPPESVYASWNAFVCAATE